MVLQGLCWARSRYCPDLLWALLLLIIAGAVPGKALNLTIYPSTKLENETLYVIKGSNVEFNCSGLSDLVVEMSWVFQDSDLKFTSRSSVNGTFVNFALWNIVPESQGNYTCLARNVTDGTLQQSTVELLVYYPPSSAPECQAVSSDRLDMILSCSWSGGYPAPTLYWRDDETDLGTSEPQLEASRTENVFNLTVNLTQQQDGKKFKCVGAHPASRQKMEEYCIVTLSAPFPTTNPLVTCFTNKNVTLTCKETSAYPDSRITWLKSKNGTELTSGSKYIISQTSRESTLTIINCSQVTDTDIYFCKAENLVGVKEAELLLSVTSPRNVAGLVGALVAFMLLGAVAVVAVILYYNRHTFFKGNYFGSRESHDVLTLVDSDGEEEELTAGNLTGITSVVNGHVAPCMSTPQPLDSYGERPYPNPAEMPKEDSSTPTNY